MSENKSPFVNLVLSISSTCCNKRQELSGNFNVNGVQNVNDPSASTDKKDKKVELEKSESIDQIIESVVEEPQV